jgi:hypothetical protein
VFSYKLIKLPFLLFKSLVLNWIRADRVSWHGDGHGDPAYIYLGVDLFETFSSDGSFPVIGSFTVLKGEEALPYRVAVTDLAIINESHFGGKAPTKQVASNLAAKTTRPQKEA